MHGDLVPNAGQYSPKARWTELSFFNVMMAATYSRQAARTRHPNVIRGIGREYLGQGQTCINRRRLTEGRSFSKGELSHLDAPVGFLAPLSAPSANRPCPFVCLPSRRRLTLNQWITNETPQPNANIRRRTRTKVQSVLVIAVKVAAHNRLVGGSSPSGPTT